MYSFRRRLTVGLPRRRRVGERFCHARWALGLWPVSGFSILSWCAWPNERLSCCRICNGLESPRLRGFPFSPQPLSLIPFAAFPAAHPLQRAPISFKIKLLRVVSIGFGVREHSSRLSRLSCATTPWEAAQMPMEGFRGTASSSSSGGRGYSADTHSRGRSVGCFLGPGTNHPGSCRERYSDLQRASILGGASSTRIIRIMRRRGTHHPSSCNMRFDAFFFLVALINELESYSINRALCDAAARVCRELQVREHLRCRRVALRVVLLRHSPGEGPR